MRCVSTVVGVVLIDYSSRWIFLRSEGPRSDVW